MMFNEDDRAQRLLDLVPDINGQINVSYVNSTKHIVAWHYHKIQTDYWVCLLGSFKVGLSNNGVVTWEYLSDKNFRCLTIPPGTAHGYMALQPNSILLYYLSHKYNNNDEYRLPVGYFKENWGVENK